MRRFLAIGVLAAALLPVAAPAADGAPVRGTIEIRHADDFAHGRTHTSYHLLHHGRRTPLVLARPPSTPSGSQVVVRGRRSGSRIRGTVRSRSGLLHAATVTPGPRKTAVILINFPSDRSTPYTAASARSSVFTSSSSANAFYAEDSYGDVSLVGNTRSDGDVYGWYQIAAPVGTCSDTDVNTWASQAKSAAAADGFVASAYQHIIYAFPQQSACGWSGLGELPGTQAWVNGSLATKVVAHELGHNMGLHHASSLTCTSGGVTVAYSSTCTPSEYGDPFDVMGTNARRNNAWHLQQIGFLRSANVQTATSSGTYTLTSTKARGAGTQLLRIPRGNGSPLYYDLELRASGGVFDNYLSTDPAVTGVTIHVDPSINTITQSLLLDTTPGSPGGFSDAPLAPGRTFSGGDVTVSVSAVSANTATVQVAGAPVPDTIAPSSPAPLSATPAAASVALNWSTSSDNVGVAGYRVYRDGAVLATTTGTSLTDTSVAAGGSYSYSVAAYDAAGNATSSPAVQANVPAPPAANPTPVAPPAPKDTTRPRVRILSPGGGSRVRRRALVRASATDAHGVKRLKVWVDGVRRRTVSGHRVSWRWNLRHVRRGFHKIEVRAYDAHGNVGRKSIRVRVSA